MVRTLSLEEYQALQGVLNHSPAAPTSPEPDTKTASTQGQEGCNICPRGCRSAPEFLPCGIFDARGERLEQH